MKCFFYHVFSVVFACTLFLLRKGKALETLGSCGERTVINEDSIYRFGQFDLSDTVGKVF